MKLSELEAACAQLREEFGDLEIVGGEGIFDDSGCSGVIALDANGCEAHDRAAAVDAFLKAGR